MEALRLILRYIHLIGFALLLGGTVVQYLTAKLRINQAMLWGSITQVVTGIALAAPLRGGGGKEPEPAKLAIKAILALLIFAAVFVVRKKETVSKGHFLGILGMTLVTAAVAVFWT